MPIITCSCTFQNTKKVLENFVEIKKKIILKKYAEEGLIALNNDTPKDTGKTAASWSYKIKDQNGISTITWHNSNAPEGVSVALLIQYGHATQGGGWVEGIDYINPALKPVFEKMSKDVHKEVTAVHEHNNR